MPPKIAGVLMEITPLAGADRAGHVVMVQGLAGVHVALAWQMRTPPPQYPVLQVSVVLEGNVPKVTL